MYQYDLHQKINALLQKQKLAIASKDNLFYSRFMANASAINALYNELYDGHENGETSFEKLVSTIVDAYISRSAVMKAKDEKYATLPFCCLFRDHDHKMDNH